MLRWLRLGVAGLLGTAVASACAASEETSAGPPPGSSGSGATGNGGGAADAGIIVVGDSGPSGSNGDGAACAGEVTEAELVPLDMVVMLDRSLSMLALTASGVSKWNAVTTALMAFLEDPASQGLGVGLQYFPQLKPGTPEICESHAACGANGPCEAVCANLLPEQQVPCAVNQHCGPRGDCQLVGMLSEAPYQPCVPIGADFGPGQGLCEPGALCLNGTSCELSDYTAPAVAIAALPAAAPDLIASLGGTAPVGYTPSRVALQGAIDHARDHAVQNPDRRTVVVFATDGLPSDCAPIDAPSIAAVAEQGVLSAPSIRSFAIGVFAPDQAAEGAALLDLLARAGGTELAIIVTTSGDVTQQFLSALTRARQSALSCEFRVPTASDGDALDYNEVNVELTDAAGAARPLLYVISPTRCDADGGWYYDVDPATGATPQTIRVCPSTCAYFQQNVGGKVDIRVGCKTIVKPPR